MYGFELHLSLKIDIQEKLQAKILIRLRAF
jgi:hypothetical protein